ncbi:YrdB family protein [Mucilaginibacter sp.]|uniref:YrdB family protein n=1 Tax=Mucilaginibacter sp. TaxID=1882438 RepID=UPI003D12DF48
MNTNPINMVVRFLLEVAMLAALSNWGLHLFTGWLGYAAAIGFPLMAAALWGIFRIANDPKPAPVEIPGMLRLILEWSLFTLSVFALYRTGYLKLGLIMAIVVKIHYMVSYDRTWVMMRNKPYKGFVD